MSDRMTYAVGVACVSQAAVAALPVAEVSSAPTGKGRGETYTVMHAGAKPTTIAVIGDLLDGPDQGNAATAVAACLAWHTCALRTDLSTYL